MAQSYKGAKIVLSKKIIYFKINTASKFVTLHFNFKVDATKIHSSTITFYSNTIFTAAFVLPRSSRALLQQWFVCFYFQVFPNRVWQIFFFCWRLHLFCGYFFNFKMVLPTI